MQVVVSNLLTRYERIGSGKPIVLLHGWGDSLETFRTITPRLSKDYELISLDLPGFGKTDPPHETWDLSSYAQFLKLFLEKLDVQPYAVVGHSNGGALAIHASALGTLQPERLVLLAPSGVRDRQKIRRLATKVIAKVGKVATFWLPLSTRQKLQKKLYGTVGSDMLVAPHLEETFKRTVRQDIQQDARQLSLPALLIYGDVDIATPVDPIGQRLHKLIKGSRLEVIESADHFVHQAEPTRVSKLIEDFLK
ncbi:MAG: alpha/beta hydrolase [Patescibacteria group bacterium]